MASKSWPCYVALDSGGRRQYFYHAAFNVEQCGFAERAMHFGYRVKIYGEITKWNNNLLAIEYADTKAKFWFPEDAIPNLINGIDEKNSVKI